MTAPSALQPTVGEGKAASDRNVRQRGFAGSERA